MPMINYLASQSTYVDPYDDILTRFVKGGLPTALLGIATIFIVLSLIWGALEIFKFVFYTIPEKKKAAEAEKTATAPENVTEPAPGPDVQPTDESEIVAAIVAAVTAYRAAESAEGAQTRFRVVSFRRK